LPVDSPGKTDLRAGLRKRRADLSASQRHAAAQALPSSVTPLPAWKDAQHIALYMPSDGEIDPQTLVSLARDLGKRLYLPVIDQENTLAFALWDAGVELLENRYGIPEPPPGAPRLPISGLDIIFIPVVGWDPYCNRLGMGGGFYDRTLSGLKESGAKRPVLVGLAHEAQRTERIPLDRWDVSMDYIATEAALYRRRGDAEAEVLFGDNDPGL
jgi:5-formyltetrahydrofolate cyclo-ligase